MRSEAPKLRCMSCGRNRTYYGEQVMGLTCECKSITEQNRSKSISKRIDKEIAKMEKYYQAKYGG